MKHVTTDACGCKTGFSEWDCHMCLPAGDAWKAFATTSRSEGLKYDNLTEFKTYECVLDLGLQAIFADGVMAVPLRLSASVARCNRALSCVHPVSFNREEFSSKITDDASGEMEENQSKADFRIQRP